MNATLAACAFLMGGWMLPAINDGTPSLRDEEPATVEIRPSAIPRRLGSNDSRPLDSGGPLFSRSGGMSGGRGGAPAMQPFMPAPPTSAGRSSSDTPAVAPRMPTPGFGSASPGMPPGSPQDQAGSKSPPAAGWSAPSQSKEQNSTVRWSQLPTSRPWNPSEEPLRAMPSAPSVSPYGPLQHPPVYAAQRASQNPYATSNPYLGSASSKAFSDYRQPSAVSPYMNLFRRDNGLGTIDNYNTLVRPMLEQRNMNSQFSSDIGGLQYSMHRLNGPVQPYQARGQEQPVGQGMASPGYFINYQQYFPNANPQGLPPVPVPQQ